LQRDRSVHTDEHYVARMYLGQVMNLRTCDNCREFSVIATQQHGSTLQIHRFDDGFRLDQVAADDMLRS
jgi:hypothetical protein